jgi:tripartite-type tricarboxylate transporter receptor subunit TctC
MMTKTGLTRTITAAGLAVAVTIGASTVGAQQAPYPNRPVRIIVGYGAGSSTDLPPRFIAEKLAAPLGQRVIVQNRPGAAGILAAREMLAQPADGYTLLLCTHFESINTVLRRNVPFKLGDFAPISLVTKYYYALTLTNMVPATTLEQFIQYARDNPNKLNYATIGSGSAQEIMARQLEQLSNIKMTRVPFKGGPEIMQDIITGRVHFYVAPPAAVMSHYKNQQVKILAVSSPERFKSLPEVPTVKEKGFNFVRFGWLGICARTGTPQPVIDMLNRHIVAIVATPEYQAMIDAGGSIAVSSSPDELQQVLRQTVADVATTIKEFGLEQDE